MIREGIQICVSLHIRVATMETQNSCSLIESDDCMNITCVRSKYFYLLQCSISQRMCPMCFIDMWLGWVASSKRT